MMLLLNVPYEQKDEAKELGARWNPKLKKWYVNNKSEYLKFRKWIVKADDEMDIICDHIYVVEGMHTCFRCGKRTRVIGFGIEKLLWMGRRWVWVLRRGNGQPILGRW